MNTKDIWVNEFTKRGLKVPDLINEMQPVLYEDNITSIAALDEFLNEICSLANRELIKEISYSEPNEGELKIVITKDYEAISDRLITIIAKKAEIDYDSTEYDALIRRSKRSSFFSYKIEVLRCKHRVNRRASL